MNCGFHICINKISNSGTIIQRGLFIILMQSLMLSGVYAANKSSSPALSPLFSFGKNNLNNNLSDTTLTIPVVVHIIHNNGSENISDDQVRNAIQWINDGLQHQNHYESDQGAAANIQLCLAQQDPGGAVTNGIVRHISVYTDMSLDHGFDSIVRLATWDTKKYLNIRLVKTVCNAAACNLGGFAFLPNAHGLKRDGIYLAAQSFGLDADRTVTAIHELGHYLGLYHTFEKGCKNDNCLVDGDKVCDTPPQGSVLGLCSSGSMNSCTSDEDDSSVNNPFRAISQGGLGDQDDDKSNFMDYSDLRCQKHFTHGQVDRMRTFLFNERASLLNSLVCTTPCKNTVLAGFTLSDTLVDFGAFPIISNTSTHATSFIWQLNGNVLSTATAPMLSSLDPGYFLLTLIAFSNQSECRPDTITHSFTIICQVDATHTYFIKDSTLIVEYDDAHPYFLNSYVLNAGGDTLFIGEVDSLVLSPGSYLLCSLFSNGQCKDSVCNGFQIISPSGAEICNDGLDNDHDGFVDLYDKDCSCNEQIFHGQCAAACQYLPDSFPPLEAKVKWRSGKINEGSFASHIVIGDIDKNLGGSEVILIGTKGGAFPFNFDTSSVIILSGANGTLQKKRSFGNRLSSQFCLSPLLFQNSNNNNIIAVFDRDSIYLLDSFLNKTNSLDLGPLVFDFFTFFGSADINQDGISEIYSRGAVFNENGVLLFDGGTFGCNYIGFFGQCVGGHSIVADFLDSDGLELAAGNKVFSIQLNNLSGSAGNMAIITNAEPGVEDGSTSFGDIDGDGELDVVVLRNAYNATETGLWVWNPRTGKIIAQSFTEGIGGSVPFVGDIDGDCVPEIGVNYEGKLVFYQFDGSTKLKKKYIKKTTDTNSGVIGMTMFDLNMDGRQEIIFRDQTHFTIIDGPTGNTVFSYPMLSVTGTEYPVVVDINHDGNAEILVEGGVTSPDTTYLFCFESANLPWAPARSVWNQAGYHITNVNDDLTIPRQPQNNAAFFDTDSCAQTTCPQPYNTFMCQATYRTQDGCVKWPAVDLSVDALSYRCEPDSLYLTVVVRNQSENVLKRDSVLLGIYEQGSESAILTTAIHFPKDEAGQIINADTIILAIANDQPNRLGLRFLVNIVDNTTQFSQNIKGLTPMLECDYLNNSDSLALQLAPLVLDLGPDITKCRTAVFTLQAPPGFVSYVWSDGSTQDSYSAATPGLHVLSATDVCGRVYADSVQFEIDSTLIPNLGNDTLICEDEVLIYDLAGFDQVQWLPASAISCDTCLQTIVIAKTNTSLVALTTVNGCIDVDTVNIAVQNLKKRNESLTICRGDSVWFNQSYLSQSGSYEYRTGDCDSLITLELAVLAPDSIMLPRQTICEGDSAFYLGKWWKTEINSTIKLKNQFDCDSFITFELRVIDTLLQITRVEICEGDSLFTNNQWLSDAGVYPFNFTSALGCDSIEEVHLNVLPTYNKINTLAICEGDSVLVWDQWYKTAGTYSRTYQTAAGCDSVEVLQLNVEPLVLSNRQYEICEGTTFTLNGQEFNTAGSYTLTLPSNTGCDTLLTFELTFSDRIQKTENYALCPGDSIHIHDQWISQPQTLQYTLEEGGCITEITANVTLLPQDTSSLSELLCPGDSIFIDGSWHVGNKDLHYTLAGNDGCDSIVNVYINSLQWPAPPSVDLDCENGVYQATIDLPAPWQVSWSNGAITPATTLTQSPASATVSYQNRCVKTFDLMTAPLPDLNTLPSLSDQTIQPGAGLSLNVNLDPSVWKIQWLPTSIASCDTCFTTLLNPERDVTMTLQLTHVSGCIYTRSFTILVENPPPVIVIPNVLSPSIPGENAIWNFILPTGYTLIDVSIFDRWGSRVFHGLPPWDGSFNQCPVLPGVYVYTIHYTDPAGNAVFLKGDVTVVR